MKKILSRFVCEEEGIQAVETVILLAVAVGAALLLKDYVIKFVTETLEKIFKDAGTTTD